MPTVTKCTSRGNKDGLSRCFLALISTCLFIISFSVSAQVANVEREYAAIEAGDWSGNGTEVLGAPDGSCANMGAVLKFNNAAFNFDLTGAIAVTGISAEIFAATGDPGDGIPIAGQDVGVQLFLNAAVDPATGPLGMQQEIIVPDVGPPCANAVPVNNGGTGLADWGLMAWPTPAEVSSGTFGIVFEKLEQSSIKVDSICMEVSYTTAAGPAVTEDCFEIQVCDPMAVCCLPDGSAFQPSTAECRMSAGVCDPAEFCSGSSATCPTDVLSPSTTLCNASTGVCDPAEFCDGSNASCPTDVFSPSTTVCNASTGVCDPAEMCTGSSGACPTDVFSPSTTVCNASTGICDPAEMCTGSSGACPTDVMSSTTVVCNASTGVCDPAEFCDGSGQCPTDVLSPSTTVCNASTGICDPAEFCDGSNGACPTDVFSSSTTVCNASTGVCDPAELCTGSSGACPTNVFASPATVCNPSVDECDPAETCTGSSGACPADVPFSESLCPSDPIPTNSSWGNLLMVLLLGLSGFIFTRRRRSTGDVS